MKTNWKKIEILFTIFIVSLLFIYLKECSSAKKVSSITKTTTIDYKKIVDSINKTIIHPKPNIVYIDTGSVKYKPGNNTVKWRDSIVYVTTPSDKTIEANLYNVDLEANNAKAMLQITSTGEVLDVQGTIEYDEKTITTHTIEKLNKSGLFLYIEAPLSKKPERFALGLDYQIKNTILTGLSVDYNTITNSANLNFKLGIKIF